MKLAIIIVSDPKGGEEALGRVFNGLALAAEGNEQGDDVEVLFAGAGTRWPAELGNLGHPAHGLYEAVRELVKGASAACAKVFGAEDDLRSCAVPALSDNRLPGTPGLASLRHYVAAGWQTLVF